MDCERRELQNMVFVYAPNYTKSDKYFSVKINKLVGVNNEVIIHIMDISH